MSQWSDADFVLDQGKRLRAKYEALARSGITITAQQQGTTMDRKPKNETSLSRFRTNALPEDEAKELLQRAIKLHDNDNVPYQDPTIGLTALECFWIGHRKGFDTDNPEPKSDISEQEKYQAMVEDSSSSLVVFYIYGGAFYLNGPMQYLKTYTNLAKKTGGLCYCVRQRLAPQYPFPAALLDVLYGYLSLIAPPPDALHKPIPASSIVLAGDSSGACIALSLVQTLLTIKRERWAAAIPFFGQKVSLDSILPAGLTAVSPVADLANAFPSFHQNYAHDNFIHPVPSIQPEQPACGIWPSNPPRGNLYCNVPHLHHGIASPVYSEDWSSCPPVWLSSGQEQGLDANKLLVQTMARQGVSVAMTEYELMPHSFHLHYSKAPQTAQVWDEWAEAITEIFQTRTLGTRYTIRHLNESETQLQPKGLTPFTHEDARRMALKATADMHPYTGESQRSFKL